MAPRRGLSPGTPVLEDIDIWNDNDNNEEGTGECENDAGSDADSLFVPTGPLIVSSGPSLARTPARTSLRSTRSSARRSSPSTRSTARSSSTLVPPRTSGRAPARAAARAANNTPAFPAVSLPRKEKRSYQAQTWKERNPANRSPTECPICHITLARRNHVQRHMNTAHSDDSVNVKPFKCICCPRVFTRLEHLIRHGKRVAALTKAGEFGHTGYACVDCVAAKDKCFNLRVCPRCEDRGLVCLPAICVPPGRQPPPGHPDCIPIGVRGGFDLLPGRNTWSKKASTDLFLHLVTFDGPPDALRRRVQLVEEEGVRWDPPPPDTGPDLDSVENTSGDVDTTSSSNTARTPVMVSVPDIHMDHFQAEAPFLDLASAMDAAQPFDFDMNLNLEEEFAMDANVALNIDLTTDFLPDMGTDIDFTLMAGLFDDMTWDIGSSLGGGTPPGLVLGSESDTPSTDSGAGADSPPDFEGGDDDDASLEETHYSPIDTQASSVPLIPFLPSVLPAPSTFTAPSIPAVPSTETLADQLRTTRGSRDRFFGLINSSARDLGRSPAVPSRELTDYLLQSYFNYFEDHPSGSWIHAASFDPDVAITELLAAVISSGASFNNLPSVWQLGLGIQEIVRQRLEDILMRDANAPRRLDRLQTWMLSVELGVWSGIDRKDREVSDDDVLERLLERLRAGGHFSPGKSYGHDYTWDAPLASDPPEALVTKWQRFILTESYKRLCLHVFMHDIQAAVTFQRRPLMLLSELNFCFPASRDLWRAPSAETWRARYLSKESPYAGPWPRALPKIAGMLHSLAVVEETIGMVDSDLCYSVYLHGVGGIIASLDRDYDSNNGGDPSSPVWEEQKQSIYQSLCNLTADVCFPEYDFTMIAELYKMMTHVSLSDLQGFAGKHGIVRSWRACQTFSKLWVPTSQARRAVSHAGQVLYCARRMAPGSIRGFNAVALYFASLTLCVYFRLYDQAPHTHPGHAYHINLRPVVVLDTEEMTGIGAFVSSDRGVPALSVGGMLPNATTIMNIAVKRLRDNVADSRDPTPPLVQSLINLMQAMGEGAGVCLDKALWKEFPCPARKPDGRYTRRPSGPGRQPLEEDGDDWAQYFLPLDPYPLL